ncbi:uncharacterized protein [Ptychodera flava]|uniref:uncharacterized protein isoform X1 n=1 Tax=Ptychodera flava TaxID=63121 RepID=UPI00396A5C2E
MAASGNQDIDSFSRLIVRLSDRIQNGEFEKMKILCMERIGERKLQTFVNPSQLLLELRFSGVISKCNTQFLVKILEESGRVDLADDVLQLNASVDTTYNADSSSDSETFEDVPQTPMPDLVPPRPETPNIEDKQYTWMFIDMILTIAGKLSKWDRGQIADLLIGTGETELWEVEDFLSFIDIVSKLVPKISSGRVNFIKIQHFTEFFYWDYKQNMYFETQTTER